MLDINIRQLPARSDSELIAIDHDPNRYVVKLRNRSGDGLGSSRFRASKERGKYHTQDAGASAADKFPAPNLIAEKLPSRRASMRSRN
ncbi:hypothetical protein [Bradyrhizobium sp. Ash2021]|uniref:hypothetical protein n=1 Tax=Bradyrhizobium sp. Ash2021 TaxID=2954771 RepID=UPI0028169D64|nr:hypothetical protein [Bradyrhizobium sp. Ash2021]WMT73421.1 hypothetical protein NL528_36545 [Bradyrhizobium sp. Ash2021]